MLAFGGDLSPQRLLNAYRSGIFPWYSNDEPILWWSPSQRAVFRYRGRPSVDAPAPQPALEPLGRAHGYRVRRGHRGLRQLPRALGQAGTWITAAMQRAYIELHRLGHAHSVEVFDGDAAGRRPVRRRVGRMFFGESMFPLESGGSTVALAALAGTCTRAGGP